MNEYRADHTRIGYEPVSTTTDLRKLEEKLRVQGVTESECAYAERLYWGVSLKECAQHGAVSAWGVDVGHAISEDEEGGETTCAIW